MLGPVWAFDLATKTGFCAGPPNTIPRSGTVILKKPGEERAVAFGNLIAFLDIEWSARPPGLVAVEAPFHLGASQEQTNSADAVRMAYGLHGVLGGMCCRCGVPLEEVPSSVWRKHFLGYGHRRKGEGADAIKLAAVARCHLLRYFPRNKTDHNRADACGVWDWACATLARAPPQELVMFGR